MSTRPGDPRQFTQLRPAVDPIRGYKDQIDALHLQLAAAKDRIAELQADSLYWHTRRERLHVEIRSIIGPRPREQRGEDADSDLIEDMRRQLEAGCPRCATTGDDWTDFMAERGRHAPRRQA